MAVYPNTPIMAEKSISPESTAYGPLSISAAHRNNELTIPGGSSGQGWRNSYEPWQLHTLIDYLVLGLG